MIDLKRLSRNYKQSPINKGEGICREDLMYLYKELNLSSKEIAQMLACPETKVSHFCFKYALKKTKQQKQEISSRSLKEAFKNMSQNKKLEMRNKQKAWWNNRTLEQKEQWKNTVSKNSKAMWKNMSQEQLQRIQNKMNISAKRIKKNMTEEEKSHRIQAFKNTWYSASDEEKQLRNKRNSDRKKDWWHNVSEEVLKHRSKQYKQTMSSKTEEQLKDIQNKIYETKKKNNTLNISKPEKYYENILKEKYSDNLVCQYKSQKYPFACDFYIKHLDLYIDLNFHWTHGKHLFNINNVKDQEILMLWQQRSLKSKFYQNAIYTWTDLDVRKDKITTQNNINRLVFYNENEFNSWLKEDI